MSLVRYQLSSKKVGVAYANANSASFTAPSKLRAPAINTFRWQNTLSATPVTAASSWSRRPAQNVAAGTRYFADLYRQFGDLSLALAAYNAGPGRAKRWKDVKPLEGAIYAETIPFGETRDYVKKVMANAVVYSTLLEGRSPSLKSRLGTIAASNGGAGGDMGSPAPGAGLE